MHGRSSRYWAACSGGRFGQSIAAGRCRRRENGASHRTGWKPDAGLIHADQSSPRPAGPVAAPGPARKRAATGVRKSSRCEG
ncbi:hypothetical protein ppKF707_0496 [Metapseudomonas furukawaii]|uniref:Uncharacterized protein n=1 Tax=Metapseudomonas furukawaii TaxID=1149133 RepID=A0AAD1BXK7_METFU|nr:hypothetical protein ppKF707_0496 [Pseudomonas furukawaii]BAU73133.1 hypothetical protein KF707C_14450 [Pseudomonas furukawaii]